MGRLIDIDKLLHQGYDLVTDGLTYGSCNKSMDLEDIPTVSEKEIVKPILDQIHRDMMYDIYMAGVNMAGEYQGCWVRFKEIEKIVDKYMGDDSIEKHEIRQRCTTQY